MRTSYAPWRETRLSGTTRGTPEWLAAGAVALGLGVLVAVHPFSAAVITLILFAAVAGLYAPAVIAPLAVVGMFFLVRPSALAELGTTVLGLAFAGLSAVLCLELQLRRPVQWTASPALITAIIAPLALWFWLLCLAGVGSDSAPADTLKGALAVWAAVLVSVPILGRPELLLRVLRAVGIAVLAMSVAGLITTGLVLAGIAPEALRLAQVTFSEGVSRDFLFPGTFRVATFPVGGVDFPRLMGWFREPGIFQAFLIWLIFIRSSLGLPRSVVLIAGAALFFTGSTAGFGILLASSAAFLFLGARESRAGLGRKAVAVVLAAGGVALFVSTPSVGLQAKQQQNEFSTKDRADAARDGLQAFVRDPIGEGLHTAGRENSSINLLGATQEIGAVGTFSALAAFFGPLLLLRGRALRITLPALLPFGLTALVAQPLLDAPAVFFISILTVAIALQSRAEQELSMRCNHPDHR